MTPVTIVALAVPAALWLFSKSSKAASLPHAGGALVANPVPGKSVAQRMAEVIATGDPAAIRFEAGRLRLEGHKAESTELERVAGLIAAERAKGSAKVPVVQVPPVTPTPMPTPVHSPPVQPTGPNAPVLPGVPPDLQGVTLRRTNPVAYDPRVTTLQNRLIALGWTSLAPADGKFGPATESAVKAFQTVNAVQPVDGIVGPITLIKLSDPSAKGATAAPKSPAPAPKPVAVAPKPAPAVASPPKPVAVAPAPAPAAGKAPTITVALKSLPSLLRNGKATGYKAPASSGQAVRDWQQVLFDLGFSKSNPDGKFGDATEVSTRAFQTAANTAAVKSGKPKLTVDGIVGPATIARASEARIMPTGGAATFTGEYFGDDSGPMLAPPEPLADSPLPGIMPPMAPMAPNPRRALAARLYNMLELAPRGGEDRTLVSLFQQQQGLKPTGYYGPATALALAQSYGIVPPKPLFWTESRTRQSKQNYRDALRMFGERDPQRVEEWIRASDV